ncbi:YbaB/EbfC family nucleoid-associated protein [Actinomadura nitritigenes]|uniref:YbaB/EbfC family nucleoid-associated protein n=1 Tax=Actinomadura nitritigenes TaxID=134602 RepID=UPI003D93C426
MTAEWLSRYIAQLSAAHMDFGNQVRDLNDSMRSRTLTRTDSNDFVTATVNGLGQVIAVDIRPSAQQYPHRVGEAATAAVASARRAAKELRSELQKPLVTGDGDNGPLEETSEAWPRIDFNAVTSSNDPEARRRLAQAVDSFNRFQEIQERRRTTVTTCKIGRGAGAIRLQGSEGEIRVEVTRNALSDLGRTRLGEQIVAAIDEAITGARSSYQRELNQLPVGDGTLGEVLQDNSDQVSG